MDLHLFTTSLCLRDCKYCCNKQYDLNSIPYVTSDEINSVNNIFITGGEPILFTNVENLAKHLKEDYDFIGNVIVYCNALELSKYLSKGGTFNNIDGVDVSIKNPDDLYAFSELIVNNFDIKHLTMNRLYNFLKTDPTDIGNFDLIHRKWQQEFKAAPDSIFRKI